MDASPRQYYICEAVLVAQWWTPMVQQEAPLKRDIGGEEALEDWDQIKEDLVWALAEEELINDAKYVSWVMATRLPPSHM